MERHPLLLKWSITFLTCIRKLRGAFKKIYKPLIVSAMPFLLCLTLKFHTKCQIWGTLSSQELGCCATIRGMHCYWHASKPLSDILGEALWVRGKRIMYIKYLIHIVALCWKKWAGRNWLPKYLGLFYSIILFKNYTNSRGSRKWIEQDERLAWLQILLAFWIVAVQCHTGASHCH